MKNLLCTLIIAAFGAAAANADSITVVFDQPNQFGAPGQTLQFFGTITNNTANAVFLNSDDPNLSGLSFTINDLFFTTVPISLAASGQPGDSSGDIELFDVTVSNPLLDPSATYLGSYDLVGGIDGGASDLLTSASFSVTSTPEPSAIYLLLAAVTLVLLSMKARLRASK